MKYSILIHWAFHEWWIPKWMDYNGQYYFLKDDFGGSPLFQVTASIFPWFIIILSTKIAIPSTQSLDFESGAKEGRVRSWFMNKQIIDLCSVNPIVILDVPM